jgi:hypothetical protein
VQITNAEQTTKTASEHRRKYIFLSSYLEGRRQVALLDKKSRQLCFGAYLDAIHAATWALRDVANNDLKELQERNQLLFCFDETTVLNGVAA